MRVPLNKKAYSKYEIIEQANDYVSILTVVKMCGVWVPGELPSGTSLKTACPFGFMHADQGYSDALRIYPDTNSSFCFAESLSLSPVRLWSLQNDLTPFAAAMDLLNECNMTPGDVPQKEDVSNTLPYLEEALSIYCRRIYGDEWRMIQLHRPEVHDKYVQCLTLARQVHNDEDAAKWLTVCKQVMTQIRTNP